MDNNLGDRLAHLLTDVHQAKESGLMPTINDASSQQTHARGFVSDTFARIRIGVALFKLVRFLRCQIGSSFVLTAVNFTSF